mgnify:FL=1
MAGMKRFITYIYEYRDGKREKNAGFAKMEIRGTEYRLQVHLRGLNSRGEYEVSLFTDQGEKLLLFPIGKLTVLNGSGDYATAWQAEKLKQYGCTFEELDGLAVTGGEAWYCLTRWTDKEPGTAPMQFAWWQEKRDLSDAETEAGQEEIDKPDSTDGKDKEGNIWKEKEKSADGRMTEEPEWQDESLRATEMTARNIFPQFSWEDLWGRLCASYPRFEVHGERESECVRMELKDLKELPGKYWYMGNNSFLLHGFFNYRYLVLGKMADGSFFIGVPGIYQRQEHVMAAIFGFPEFLSCDTGKNQNYFGYWYQILER